MFVTHEAYSLALRQLQHVQGVRRCPDPHVTYLGNEVHNETLDGNALAQKKADGHRWVEVAARDLRHDIPVKNQKPTRYLGLHFQG